MSISWSSECSPTITLPHPRIPLRRVPYSTRPSSRWGRERRILYCLTPCNTHRGKCQWYHDDGYHTSMANRLVTHYTKSERRIPGFHKTFWLKQGTWLLAGWTLSLIVDSRSETITPVTVSRSVISSNQLKICYPINRTHIALHRQPQQQWLCSL